MLDVLIVTNLFAFLYPRIVLLLNSNTVFGQPMRVLTELQYIVIPEPYEIPVYFFLLFLGFIYIVLRSDNIKKMASSKQLNFITIVLVFLLVMNLGPYPLTDFEVGSNIALAYALILLLYIGLFWFMFEKAKKTFLVGFVYILLFLSLAILLFAPGLPVQSNDFSYFFGPVLQISRGVHMYTDVAVQYGFLSIILLALLVKEQVLNPFSIATTIWAMYVVEYILIFMIVSKMTKSKIVALITLGSVLTVSHFSLLTLAIRHPQTGAFRWLAFFIIIAASLFSKIAHKKFIIITALMTLMNIDTGVAIAITYAMTLCSELFTRTLTLIEALKAYILYIIFVIFFFCLCMILFLLMQWPLINPLSMFHTLSQYAQGGVAMLPVSIKTYFWLVLFIYFSALWYGIQRKATTLVLAANCAVMGSIYFIGRSHPHALFHISVLIIPVIGILVGMYYQHLTKKNNKSILLIAYIIVGILIPITFRGNAIKTNLLELRARYKSGPYVKTILETKLQKNYIPELQWLTKNNSASPILILSIYDSYLYYLTNRNSLTSQVPIIASITSDALRKSAQQISLTCPSRLYVDKSLLTYKRNAVSTNIHYADIAPHYYLYKEIQKQCKGEYITNRCNNLCEVIFKQYKPE